MKVNETFTASGMETDTNKCKKQGSVCKSCYSRKERKNNNNTLIQNQHHTSSRKKLLLHANIQKPILIATIGERL